MKKTLCFILFLCLNSAFSKEWSRFIISQNQDDVSISFRQQKQNNAWRVQWQVKNDSLNTVEPYLKKRNYLCANNHTQKMGAISLGVYAAKQKRLEGLTDTNICPNSRIKLVEIETEIKTSKQ